MIDRLEYLRKILIINTFVRNRINRIPDRLPSQDFL